MKSRILLILPTLALSCASDSATPEGTFRDGAIACSQDLPVVFVQEGVPFQGSDDAECIVGTNEADVIAGGGGDDVILAKAGDDTVDGGEGADAIGGGNGKDLLDGGPGDDRIHGGNGTDTLIGGRGADELDGMNASDRLDGGPGDDVLGGGKGDDELVPGAGADLVMGGNGDDRIVLANLCEVQDGDQFDGGSGDDELVGPSAEADVASAGAVRAGLESYSIDASGADSADCTTVDEPVGPEGGEVATPDGETVIVIPPGAVGEEITISVNEVPPEVQLPAGIVGDALELGPDGTQFDVPLTIAFEVSQSMVDQVGLENLAVATLTNGTWTPVAPDPNYQGGPLTVTGLATHFSYWGVFPFCPSVIDAPAGEQSNRNQGGCGFPICGDGVLGLGEQCDDGSDNGTGASGCSADCRCDDDVGPFGPNGCSCGDGVVDPDAGEACDAGMSNGDTDDDCSQTCECGSLYLGECHFCGDGALDAGLGEACDDGDTDDGNGCDNSCNCPIPERSATNGLWSESPGPKTVSTTCACPGDQIMAVDTSTLAGAPTLPAACFSGFPMVPTGITAGPDEEVAFFCCGVGI